MDKKRCQWAEVSDLDREYHDNEWGVPVHSDQQLFESLILEGAQAGIKLVYYFKKTGRLPFAV